MEVLVEDYKTTEVINGMMLSKLLESIPVSKIFQTTYGRMAVTHEVEVRSIQYDSRKVERGDMFVALRGSADNGNKFIVDAVDRGARAVVTDDDSAMVDSFFMHAGVVKIVVPDARAALAQMASSYYGQPSQKLTIVGVTGTNGKTTTTHIIKALLEAEGNVAGLIGTINYQFGHEQIPATHTTPESLELNQFLARMVEKGCSAAVMEVSSHALHQQRVHGIEFDAAVFTNLTQDHLDYHGTMEEYFKAKQLLFDGLKPDAWGIVNVDDEWGHKLSQTLHSKRMTYGLNPSADVCAGEVTLSVQGLRLSVRHMKETSIIESPLMGRFNVYNILASFTACLVLGIPKTVMCATLREFKPVRGRFERIVSAKGWTTVIDYAHTPDALEKALVAIRDVLCSSRGGRIITVFGCGGNRDRTKRPKMGKIATELSDITVVTSDNPRHEDPETIIDEIMTGVRTQSMVYRETDRKKAVILAMNLAKPGDIVLVAGKGHEDYQVIGDQKIHCNDHEIVEEYLQTHA